MKILRSINKAQILTLLLPFLFFIRLTAQDLSPSVVFNNPVPITINTVSSAALPKPAAQYPAQISVTGMTGTITRVMVTLTGITASSSDDMDFLLVGPGGQEFIFASDLGGPGLMDDRVFIFDDEAATTMPVSGQLFGSYKPTSGDAIADTFPSPAPAGPYHEPPTASFASVFNGTNPNGVWSLYVVDDKAFNASVVDGGWTLSITTAESGSLHFSNTARIDVNDTIAASSNYGSPINVNWSGYLVQLKVTLHGYSHTRPGDVDVLLVSPNGQGVMLMSEVGGNPVSNVTLTFDEFAAQQLPVFGGFGSGSYKTSDYTSSNELRDFLPGPAPPTYFRFMAASTLRDMLGSTPTGTWRLYVVDDTPGESGTISGGWSIELQTALPAPIFSYPCATPNFIPTNIPVGDMPANTATGWLSGSDNNYDIAVANYGSNNISILRGNGDGTFAPQPPVPVGSGPYGIMSGYFNNDLKQDLIVTNSNSDTISLLYQNASGGFDPPVNLASGPTPYALAAGDFNGDQKSDIAVANYGGFRRGSVSIFLGDNNGSYTPGPTLQTALQPAYLMAVNFNADSFSDLVVANYGASSISVFRGGAGANFTLFQEIPTDPGPRWVELNNFNNDSFADLMTANFSSNSISGCAGAAGGIFTCSSIANFGLAPTAIVSEDFRGRGQRREAVSLAGENVVRTPWGDVPTDAQPNSIDSSDLDGDGHNDIVTANTGSDDITFIHNNCHAPPSNLFDFDGDGRTDHSVYRSISGTWYDHEVQPLSGAMILGRPADRIVPADYTGDGKTDYAVFRSSTATWIVRDQTSRTLFHVQFGQPGNLPVPADYNGDGTADLAVFNLQTGDWSVRSSSDNSVYNFHWGANGDLPVPADFDGDGRTDYAVFRRSTGDWYVWRTTGGFWAVHWGANGDIPFTGDIDEDGKADVGIFRPVDNAWYMLRSSDLGWKGAIWGAWGDVPVPGEYDGDGRTDFAVYRRSDRTWYVLRSSDGGFDAFPWGEFTDTPAPYAYMQPIPPGGGSQ